MLSATTNNSSPVSEKLNNTSMAFVPLQQLTNIESIRLLVHLGCCADLKEKLGMKVHGINGSLLCAIDGPDVLLEMEQAQESLERKAQMEDVLKKLQDIQSAGGISSELYHSVINVPRTKVGQDDVVLKSTADVRNLISRLLEPTSRRKTLKQYVAFAEADDAKKRAVATAVTDDMMQSLLTELSPNDDDGRRDVVKLITLVKEEAGFSQRVVKAEMIRLLVPLLSDASSEIRANAANIVRFIARNSANGRVFVAEGAIEPVVSLLHDDDWQCRRNTSHALNNLSNSEFEGASLFAKAGAIEALVSLLRDNYTEVREVAALVIKIFGDSRFTPAIAGAGGVEALVALLRDADGVVRSNAVAALMNLTGFYDSEVAKKLVCKAGAAPLLRSLLNDLNTQTRNNAQCVLNYIEPFATATTTEDQLG